MEFVKKMSKTLGQVLIGGGTGFIGSHLCNILKSQGHGVTVISRMPGPQRLTWNDLNRSGLPTGTTAVINLAGQNVLDVKQRWNSGFKQNVFNSRINTTIALAEAIEKAERKPHLFLTFSGVGIYKPDPKVEYSENEEGEAFDFFSTLCHAWERAAKLDTVGVRHVAIRSGVVLGRDGGMIKQLYLPFFLGLGGPVSPGNQYLPWIHIDDIVGLILFAMYNSKVEGVVNGVAPQLLTNKEFSDAFARALKRPAVIPVPQILLEYLLSKERANMLTQGQKVLPTRALDLGYEFKFPNISSACRDIVNKRL